jgi:RHS repeat-associated protein
VLASTTGITTTDYLYGQDRLAAITSGARAWYLPDGLGSVRQTLDDSAAVLTLQSYDPYDQPEGSALGTTFGYTGQLQDNATNAEYLRARWYQPGTGQLLGVDPALDSTGQAYAYAG